MSYTHCKTLIQVREVLRNYDGRLYRDCDGLGYVIDVDLSETYGRDRAEILKAANQMFKANGWRASSFAS